MFKNDRYFSPNDTGAIDTDTMSDDDIMNSDLEELGIEKDDADDSNEDTRSDSTEEETAEIGEGEISEGEDSLSEESDKEDEETAETSEEGEEETEEEPIEALPEATFKSVRAKYPNFFKEFPDVAKSFGKVRQYEEAFPTPDDAKEAQTALAQFQEIANDLQGGNPVKLLTSLADSNPDAVVEFSRNILPVLSKLDEGLFYEATLPVLSHFLKNALSAARNASDEKYGKNLEMAVQYISHWAFKKTEVPDFNRPKADRPDPERAKLDKERAEYLQERFNEANDDVQAELKQNLIKLVSSTLKSVVSLRTQSQYVTDKVTSDIIREIDRQISSDENFLKSQRSLWVRSQRSNFRDKAILSRIKSAYLERSKLLIPKVAKQVLIKAKLVKSNKPEVKRDMSPSGRVNRRSNSNVRNINPKNVDFKNTSDLDILDGKVNIRK